MRELRKAVAATPDDAETQGLLGRALYLRGDYDTARLCLERAAQAARPDPLGLASLGDLFERLGRGSTRRAPPTSARSLRPGPGTATCRSRRDWACRGWRWRRATPRRRARRRCRRSSAIRRGPTSWRRSGACTRRSEAVGRRARRLRSRRWWPAASGAGARGQLMLFDWRGLLEEALRAALRAGATARAASYATALLEAAPEHPDALAADGARGGGGGRARARAGAGRARARRRRLARGAAGRGRRGVEARPAGARGGGAAGARRSSRPTTRGRARRLAAVYREGAPAAPAHELYALLVAGAPAVRAHARAGRALAGSGAPGRGARSPAPGDGDGRVQLGQVDVRQRAHRRGGGADGDHADDGDHQRLEVRRRAQGARRLPRRRGARGGVGRRAQAPQGPRRRRGQAHPRRRGPLSARDPAAGERRRHARAQLDRSRARGDGAQVHRRGRRGPVAVHRRPGGQGDRGRGARQDQGRGQEDPRRGQQDRSLLARGARAHRRARARRARRAPRDHRAVRRARGARRAQARPVDEAQLAASNYPALASALEERFFSRARAIKREAATTRLGQLLAQARAVGQARLDRRALEPLAAAEAAVRAERVAFERDFIVAERRRLNEAADAVYAACAREVLDFVRPRRWPFGSNEAAPADCDFLIQLLDERLGALLDAGRARAELEAERAIALVRAVDDGADWRALRRRALASVVAARRAGVRPLPRLRPRLSARRPRRRLLHARPAQARALRGADPARARARRALERRRRRGRAARAAASLGRALLRGPVVTAAAAAHRRRARSAGDRGATHCPCRTARRSR